MLANNYAVSESGLYHVKVQVLDFTVKSILRVAIQKSNLVWYGKLCVVSARESARERALKIGSGPCWDSESNKPGFIMGSQMRLTQMISINALNWQASFAILDFDVHTSDLVSDKQVESSLRTRSLRGHGTPQDERNIRQTWNEGFGLFLHSIPWRSMTETSSEFWLQRP